MGRRLHTDDLDLGSKGFGGDRDPRDEPTPADRDEKYLEVRDRGQHFEGDRTLPGDHRRIVVGMDEAAPEARAQRLRLLRRLLHRATGQDHLGAELLRVVDLHEGCGERHHDRHRHAEPARVIGHALSVVAGRHRHDAGGGALGRQLQEVVERAAFLERGRVLQVLELEPDAAAQDLTERAALEARRFDHPALDPLGRGPDVVEARQRGRRDRRCPTGEFHVRRGCRRDPARPI